MPEHQQEPWSLSDSLIRITISLTRCGIVLQVLDSHVKNPPNRGVT